VIAVDTNVLVNAHRKELADHRSCLDRLRGLAEGLTPWGLPVFCLAEFVRVVTHPRVFDPPSSLDAALEALEGLLASPTVRVLEPGARFWRLLERCLRQGDARGNLAFDAQIAAACLEHGAREILTLDRDFARFEELKIVALEG
jgi:hypothetical protein